tara:strand:+ start:1768 stop:2184 length:417 start_codon:yes stop_codon:yes gene_type:complete
MNKTLILPAVRKLKYVNVGRVDSILSPTIRVSLGDVHLPFLTLVSIDGESPSSQEFFFCTHEKRALPIPRKLVGCSCGVQHRGDLHFVRVDKPTWLVVSEAISQHELHSGSHLNSHTFVVAWCLSKGIDLYKERLLSL